jgi:hypothetical protein
MVRDARGPRVEALQWESSRENIGHTSMDNLGIGLNCRIMVLLEQGKRLSNVTVT